MLIPQVLNTASIQRSTVALVAIAGLCLAGCQGTTHDRWARASDSVDVWSPKMASLPIEVHGSVPGADASRTVARIPNGTNAGSLASSQRIVLYVGGSTLPVNSTYCGVSPTLRSVRIPDDKVMMGAALCDGRRLVVTARQEFAPAAVTDTTMSHSIEELKTRLKFALAVGPRQIPSEGPG